MRRALVLGSALCVWDDIDRATELSEYDVVVACKGMGVLWPHRLDAWVSLHDKMLVRDVEERARRGLPPATQLFCHMDVPRLGISGTKYRFADQRRSASSGIFGAKVALEELQCDRVVLCGIPLDSTAGKLGTSVPWPGASSFRQGFEEALPHLRDRVRSMSGWTSQRLGLPTAEWLRG